MVEHSLSWLDVFTRLGPFTYLLGALGIMGLILTIISIYQCHPSKRNQVPCVTRLLPSLALLSFFVGVWGFSAGRVKGFFTLTILGSNISFADMAQLEVESVAAITYGSIIAIIYTLAYIISVMRFNVARKNIMPNNGMNADQ